MKNSFGKLATISVSGYKSILSLDRLRMDDINLIIGPNGAGKSNFISLFRFIHHLVQEELQDFVVKQGGLQKVLYGGPRTTQKLTVNFDADINGYEVTLGVTRDGRLVFEEEYCSFNGTRKRITTPEQFETNLRRTRGAGRIPAFILSKIESWRVHHFHDTSESAPLRRDARMTGIETLAGDGGNLPAFLYYLQERHPETLEEIEDTVRRIAPFFGRFILKPEPLNRDLIRLRWRHRGIEEPFDVSDFSDGTLRFIALVALLLQPEPPDSTQSNRTVVLDEPELGLHPAALALLASVMHSVKDRVQIICSTQSVTFANQFSWQDIIVADRSGEASTFRRLEEKEVKAWMDEYSMGEAWEKNLIGGRPR